MSCIDASVRIVTKSPKVGPLLRFSISLCSDNMERFPNKTMPRWNFTDFMHSFMIVFRVLCGEWIGRQQTFFTLFTQLLIFLTSVFRPRCAPVRLTEISNFGYKFT